MKSGDRARAVRLMTEHIGNVETGLTVRAAPGPDPLQGLRDVVQAHRPIQKAKPKSRSR